MTLQDILDQLTYGELSQLDMGGNSDEFGLSVGNTSQVLSHIDMGLIDLHKRFNLHKGTVVLTLNENVDMYRIHSSASMVNGTAAIPYLADTVANPFQDNLLKIERIETMASNTVKGITGSEDGLVDLPLNDIGDKDSAYTTGFDTLTFSKISTGQMVIVHFRATHVAIDIANNAEPETIEVCLSRAHLLALVLFVASRIYANMATLTGQQTATEYYQKYEAECQRIGNLGLEQTSYQTNNKLQRKGFI